MINNLKTSQKGIDLIAQFEGCKTQAYYDIVGVLTIGYGHTGADVKKNMIITQEQAQTLLKSDLLRFETTVNHYVTVPLTQNQFDALVCFVYNVGSGNFSSSTLLKLLNAGNYVGAADQFVRWNKAGGQVVNGLTNRRLAEKQLFLS